MLVDDIEVTFSAGHGGAGKVSFAPGSKSGPDGGNGGKGGDLYFHVTSDLRALNQFSQNNKVGAKNGNPGQKKQMYGKDGEDITITLPVGTLITDVDTQEEWELLEVGELVQFCKGGKGGKGNFEFRSSRNTTPMYAQPGLAGERHHVRLQLKYLAEFGLIGLPNAGKSSLLNEITNAKANVGDYPFTTLEPNLGVVNDHIIADIPGLIEGASQGKGLGIRFLKHIEKVKVLLHCISADSIDVVADFQTVTHELTEYSPIFAKKQQIIMLTKTDLVDESTLKKQIKALSKLKISIMPISIHNLDQVNELVKFISQQS